MKKLLIGLIVSGVFIYLSLRGVDFSGIIAGLKKTNYSFILFSLLFFLFLPLFRSLRWGAILSPFVKVEQKTLFPVTCIGFMAITLIPMRIGEIVRPSLISIKKGVPLSSSLATVVVERVLDMLTLVVILFLVLIILPLPSWVFTVDMALLGVCLLLMAIMILFVLKKEASTRFFSFIFMLLPAKLNPKINGLLKTFIEGFTVISDFKKFGYILFLTLLIWGFSGLAIYILFYAYNLQIALIGAFTVLTLTGLGISLPAAPGFLGNVQFATIFALSLFGVSKTDALTFSIIYHVVGIGINVILGLIFLPFESVSFKEIKSFRNF